MINGGCAEWGTYAPAKDSVFLRFLIKIGLGRGAVRAKILRRWKKKYGNLLDINVRGINYRLNLNDNVTDAKIFASSIVYDKEELSFLQSFCHDGVFVDIGANIGYYSLVLAKEARCKVVSIEANPPTVERLQFNVSINSSLQERICIVPLGVGDEGEFELYSEGNLGGASFHKKLHAKSNDSVKVKTKPLYNILCEQQIEHIDALKIDIEGMEDVALAPFFESAPRTMWPKCIVIEDDHKHVWKVDLMEILRKKGCVEVGRTSGNALLRLKKS